MSSAMMTTKLGLPARDVVAPDGPEVDPQEDMLDAIPSAAPRISQRARRRPIRDTGRL
jgi:hypothetical protein